MDNTRRLTSPQALRLVHHDSIDWQICLPHRTQMDNMHLVLMQQNIRNREARIATDLISAVD